LNEPEPDEEMPMKILTKPRIDDLVIELTFGRRHGHGGKT
jgi:hypothetical protein